MGRRKNSTKSGRYKNPLDITRKNGRKKELKKNKKQRIISRNDVVKRIDPLILLREMEKIDQMEYNVIQPPPLIDTVLREKRKKLKLSFNRIMKMYLNEEVDKYHEVKRAQSEYEKRRITLISYFDAVKATQHVSLDDIPLPASDSRYNSSELPTGILQKHPIYYSLPMSPISETKKQPPGVPPSVPPIITYEENDYDDDSSDGETGLNQLGIVHCAKTENSGKKNKITDREIFISEIDKYKKISMPEKTTKSNEISLSIPPLSGHVSPGLSPSMSYDGLAGCIPPGLPSSRPPILPPGLPPNMPINMIKHNSGMSKKINAAAGVAVAVSTTNIVSDVPHHGSTIYMPPGPPPSRPPILPPGPPPGMPLYIMKHNSGMSNNVNVAAGVAVASSTPNIVRAEPQLIDDAQDTGPKMRNFDVVVTQFLPRSIRVKGCGDKSYNRDNAWEQHKATEYKSNIATINQHAGHQTKYDAYMQFMEEIKNLL